MSNRDGVARGRALTRRTFLKAGSAGVLVGMTGLLTACRQEDEGGARAVGGEAAEPTPTTARDEASPAPAPGPEGTLRVAHTSEWAGREVLDPASPNRFFPPVELLYNRLVREDESGLATPELAESWEPDVTAQQWTFTLRQGVTFHDGKPLTAADVVYTMNHIVDPELGSPGAPVLEIIDMQGFETPDDRTVVFSLNSPHADFPTLLLHYSCNIIPEGSGDTIATTGIGTGPFKLETFDPDGTTVLVANPDYWEGSPRLARIETIGIADEEARVNALLADQVDFLGRLGFTGADLIARNPAYEVHILPTGSWLTLAMRTDSEPFDDERVRLAMKLVVDRQAAIDIVLRGNGVSAYDHPVWPGDPYALRDPREQDIDRARELLAEAGYPDGLSVTLYTSDIEFGMVDLAIAYQEMAAEAGIQVEIQQAPADGYWNDVWLVEPFCTVYWGQRPADQVLNELYRCGAAWNETAFCDQEFEGLLDAARTELDFDARVQLYHQAQRILMDRGGSIIPFFRSLPRAMHRRVGGIEPDQRYIRWHEVDVEE